MKKLTKSVLAVVLTASFSVSYAQKAKVDTAKTRDIGEVIVTGALGIKKKVDAQTSSQQVVTASQLNTAANPNAVNALVGKVAGLQISQTNTSVTGTNSILIRGARTISGDNSALVVIDNVISSSTVLQQLPPEIIESINVIKGAAGAALYGSQGINGAIVVTTKRGLKSGKLRVTLNSSVDFENIAFMPERQREYGQGWSGYKISVENGGWGVAFNDPSLAGQLVPYGIPHYDYDGSGQITYNPDDDAPDPDNPAALQSIYAPYGKDNVREFFKTGSIFQNTLTVNTGNSDGYVLLSLGNVDRDFVVQDDTMKRMTAMLKGGMKTGKWRFDGTINYIRQKTSVTDSDIYHQLLQSAADIPIVKYKDFADYGYGWNVYYTNPYFYIKHDRNNSLRNYFNFIASTEFELNKHVNFLYRGNVQFTNIEGDKHNDGWNDARFNDMGIKFIQSFYEKKISNAFNYYGDFMANFDYDLSDAINLKLNVGHNYQEWRTSVATGGGTGIKIPGIYQVWNLSNPTPAVELDNTSSHRNLHALFANLDLSYDNYLFLNLTGRNEWNSVLPLDNRSFFYPSASLSFVPTKAFDGLKGSILNYAKVSAAYQMTGNASAIPVYSVYNRAVVGYGFPYSTGDISFGINNAQVNKDIKPEFTTKKEVNLFLGFLNDRVTLDASVYREDTKDLITNATTSSTTGLTSYLFNIGKLRGEGLELTLGLTPIKSKDFTWEIGASYSTNRTKVVKLADGATSVQVAGNSSIGLYAQEGEDFLVLKGNTYLRDDNGSIIVDALSGLPTITSTQQILGKTNPKYILGLTTNIKVKGFTLSAVMDYRTGHKFYSGSLEGFTFNGMNIASAGFDRNQPYIVPNSVYLQNGAYVANTNLPIYATSPTVSNYDKLINYFSGNSYRGAQDNFILDATAFKIREISLSYSFGKNILGESKINELTIGLHARNPFYKFAKENKGYDDPETSISNFTGIAGTNQYPNLKTFGGSVTLTF